MLETGFQRDPSGDSLRNRTFDVAVAALGLVALSVPLALLMIAIKAESRGPIFFRQTRVGRHGRPFQICKLRTMSQRVVATGPGITFGEDSRVTLLGRILRRWKLDELPQLINVLRGEMNLVGPRPELPQFVARYAADDRRVVLSVAPGLTDFASIRFRNENELLAGQADPLRYYEQVVMPAKLRYYRFYVRRATLRLDIYIILRTIRVLAGDLLAAIRPARRRTGITSRQRQAISIRG